MDVCPVPMCLGVLRCEKRARGLVVREMETFNSVPQGFPGAECGGGVGWGVRGRTDRPYGPPSLCSHSFPLRHLTGSLQQVQGIVVWARGHRTGCPQNGNDLQEERPQRSGAKVPKDAANTHWHQINVPQMPGGRGRTNEKMCSAHGSRRTISRELVTLSVPDTHWRVWGPETSRA